jgi:hypothetical protein
LFSHKILGARVTPDHRINTIATVEFAGGQKKKGTPLRVIRQRLGDSPPAAGGRPIFFG